MAESKDGQQHKQASILFTAFEPSGDAHAAPVIRALLDKAPKLKIYALGGPLMEQAGATIVEKTVLEAAMGVSALKRVAAVRKQVQSIRRWSKMYRVLGHVPVDSPAANWSICKEMRASGARIIHLVAPQLWAWGSWRAAKLRKLTDLVLCLLPFEEEWFTRRDIPARFIGHPRVNRPLDLDALRLTMHGLPQGAPRVALFPGSRAHEVRANTRLFVDVYAELQGRHAAMGGVIVAASPDMATIIRRKIKVFPTGLHMTTGMVDAAIGWSDICIACSGTVTLDITRHQRPMIGVYKTSMLSWLGSKFVLRTPYRLLPNLIAGREIVPELVPYCGGPLPIVKQANHYLQDSKNAAIQAEELGRVCHRFVNKNPAQDAARHIIRMITKGEVD